MTESFLQTIQGSTGVVLLYMIGWYVLSLRLRRMDIVDIAWGLGFVVITVTAFLSNLRTEPRGWIVLALVAIWGLRLSSYLFRRVRSHSEDQRYVAMRERWGRSTWWRSLTDVFLLQGGLMLVIALAVMAIMSNAGTPLGWLDILGVVVWITGFVFESVGDAQLRRFLRDPSNSGKLMTTGLWKYTRHPNYFGEMTQWWGIWLLALSVPNGWLTVIAPATITFFLIKVSGVPLLEKKYTGRPDWETYRRRTSMILPWFPKN